MESPGWVPIFITVKMIVFVELASCPSRATDVHLAPLGARVTCRLHQEGEGPSAGRRFPTLSMLFSAGTQTQGHSLTDVPSVTSKAPDASAKAASADCH